MKSRLITTALICGLWLGSPSVVLFAEPEALDPANVRNEIMQEAGPVSEFLEKNLGPLKGKVEEAGKAGKIKGPEDMKALVAEDVRKTFALAVEFRKSLKEPEHRLRLDSELIQVGAMAGLMDEVIACINNWKAGPLKDSLTLSAAQSFQQTKTDFTAPFNELLKEAAKSSDPRAAQLAANLLNPFFRNPAGEPFPAFPAGKKTTDGKDLSLDRFKGKVLLVDFWATWCPPCRKEIPSLVKAYKDFKDKGFEIVGISFDKEKDAFESYLKENDMLWPQYYDGKGWENEVGPTYGIQSIPGMYLIDGTGKVITTDLREGKLEEQLKKILK